MRQRTILVGCGAIVALNSCGGGGLNGEYGGDNCMYNKITFKKDGTATFSLFGMEMPGKYTKNGDKVSITSADGRGLTFTVKGNVLDAGIMKCTKL